MDGTLFEGPQGSRLRVALLAATVVLVAFLGIKALGELMELRYIGAGISPTNIISVSGYGEAVAVPDIATFTFSVTSEKSTVAAAQNDVTEKINAITEYLEAQGIAERDVQTSGYSVYPQYDYQTQACRVGEVCSPGKQVLRGYEVRQTTTVKVRDTGEAGELLTAVGSRGATEVSGLNFTFDDPDAVEAEARDEAIADAKEKAQVLARSLGVSLVRVVSFSENGGGMPSPLYYATDSAVAYGGAIEERAAPKISIGENKVTSSVYISYEIR